MSDTLIACRQNLLNRIHRLQNQFPIGIERLDNERDAKLQELIEIYRRIYND